MNKKEVLYFLPRWSSGGMERAAVNMVRNASDPEYQYQIVVGNYEENFAEKELADLDITIDALQESDAFHFVTVLIKFNSYLSKHPISILHCHINNGIGLIFAFVAKIHGVNVIAVHTHNSSFGSGHLWLKKTLRFVSLVMFRRIPDLYFACSNEAGRWTFGNDVVMQSNYHVVYNGIDSQKFRFSQDARSSLRETYHLQNKFVMGHVGHFNYQKNQEFLICLMPLLLVEIPDIHLFLIGTGETRMSMMERARQTGCLDHISWIDPVSDVEAYYSMFDLFVLPSRFEGFGIVAVEAQYNGLHVIASNQIPCATDISGNIEYLPVDTEDSMDQWLAAIIKAGKSKRSTEFTGDTDKFDNKKISKTIETAYTKALAERRER